MRMPHARQRLPVSVETGRLARGRTLSREVDAGRGEHLLLGAVYNGDANNSTVSTCGGVPEQIVIGKASPAISTVASPTAGTVGKAIKALKDTATLTGAPIAPTGTVTFNLYSNSTCTTAVTGVSGSGTVASASASYTVAWTPKAAGTYYWTATYSGDSNNNSVASACGEPVLITAQPTISTTANPKSAGTGTTLQDSATLSATSNLLGTGSITFRLYAPGDGSCASAIHTETVTAVKTNGPFNTTTGFTAKTVGTYQWTAAFSGDVNNAAVTSKCGADPVTVGPQISEITPIAATCAQFASGFATSMPSYQYTLSGSKIATVTPSSFTYWVKAPLTGTYKITQSTNETSKKLLLSSGSGVYDNATASSCTTVSSGIAQSTTSDAVTVKVSSGSGPFYIGLIFSTSKVIGEAARARAPLSSTPSAPDSPERPALSISSSGEHSHGASHAPRGGQLADGDALRLDGSRRVVRVPSWKKSITQVPGNPSPPLMVTTLPAMEHDPGVLALVSIPNWTASPDDAVPDKLYVVCVMQRLHGGDEVGVTVCDACATLNVCCRVSQAGSRHCHSGRRR